MMFPLAKKSDRRSTAANQTSINGKKFLQEFILSKAILGYAG